METRGEIQRRGCESQIIALHHARELHAPAAIDHPCYCHPSRRHERIVADIDRTDGIRVKFSNGEILHLRPSGNAPEFRCYSEAGSAGRATDLCAGGLGILARLG